MENRRKRRTKADIENCIMEVATKIIGEKGFAELKVTEIARQAQIEPIVFYNRYADLTEFVDEYVKKYDYWFSNIVSEYKNTLDKQEKHNKLLASLFESLLQNKVMQQLLRWELATNNDTTKRTARLREFHTMPLSDEYSSLFSDSQIDIVAISALIVGGLYYLILHKDLAPFSNIDINTPEGKARIEKATIYLSDLLFTEKSKKNEIEIVAKKMKHRGIDMEIIAECTGLSVSLIERL